MPRPNYTHITIECQGCPPKLLNSGKRIRRALGAAAEACSLHVVQEGMHRFRPHGITGYLLLKESHISIHTWPEHSFALVDVLSCSRLDIDNLVNSLRVTLSPRTLAISQHTKRGAIRGRAGTREDSGSLQ